MNIVSHPELDSGSHRFRNKFGMRGFIQQKRLPPFQVSSLTNRSVLYSISQTDIHSFQLRN